MKKFLVLLVVALSSVTLHAQGVWVEEHIDPDTGLRTGVIADNMGRLYDIGPGANLNRALLMDCDLRDANLRGAELFGAIFLLANLSGADLSGADLSGTDLGLHRGLQGQPRRNSGSQAPD